LSKHTFRQSYTLRHDNIGRLAVLSRWEDRTPSQQVDNLIFRAFTTYRDSLDAEQRAAFDSEFNEEVEVV